VCYRLGAGGLLGRRSGLWYGRCLSWPGLSAVRPRLEKPGRWVVELAQQGAGGDGGFVAGEDLLQRLGRRARADGLGPENGVGVAVADDLKVEVIGCPAAGEHGVQLLS